MNVPTKRTVSWVKNVIKIMLVRGVGIRDIGIILKSTKYQIRPKQSHYDCLEIDEFWIYRGKKKNKVWLVYAYHRDTREIVALVWGKRDLKTAQKPWSLPTITAGRTFLISLPVEGSK
jgi:hypothetical protein